MRRFLSAHFASAYSVLPSKAGGLIILIKETLSEDALAAVLSAPPRTKTGLRDRAILVTLYDSAVRLDELLSIKLGDMMLVGEYPCIYIHGNPCTSHYQPFFTLCCLPK